MYFGKPVHEAIIQYQKSDSFVEKNRLVNNVILPALSKLAENRIHHAKFYNYGSKDYAQIKYECISHLFDRLNNFDHEKGYKAFSYFDKITRNWVWANMKSSSKEQVEHKELECVDQARNVVNEVVQEDYMDDLRDFCQKWAWWGIDNIELLFEFKKERQVANAVFNLFGNCHSIDIYNKKALYIMVREQVEVKTQIITNVIKILRPLQKAMFQEFIKTGTRNWKGFITKKQDKPHEQKNSENRRAALYNG